MNVTYTPQYNLFNISNDFARAEVRGTHQDNVNEVGPLTWTVNFPTYGSINRQHFIKVEDVLSVASALITSLEVGIPTEDICKNYKVTVLN